ncbi:uncharacterized protein LOC119564016 [Chelonia mydas]|uniref:uncharacterized protein LOC119564016 n=1 Tax=Chelonia mydas TaxID=8469 RepID=UPI001CA90701|nr:uncharacterized protein LOC119564016 [Chelonia mydas]
MNSPELSAFPSTGCESAVTALSSSALPSQSMAQCHHPACWLGRVTPQVTTTLSSLPQAWRVRRWVRDDTEHPPSIAPSPEQDEAQQLAFLHAIYPTCLAAHKRGQDTLEPNCCKVAVVERIVELIEELPDDSPPGAILANCLIAVGNLRYRDSLAQFPSPQCCSGPWLGVTVPPTPRSPPEELETHLLRAALHAMFTLSMEKDPTQVQVDHAKVMA